MTICLTLRQREIPQHGNFNSCQMKAHQDSSRGYRGVEIGTIGVGLTYPSRAGGNGTPNINEGATTSDSPPP